MNKQFSLVLGTPGCAAAGPCRLPAECYNLSREFVVAVRTHGHANDHHFAEAVDDVLHLEEKNVGGWGIWIW